MGTLSPSRTDLITSWIDDFMLEFGVTEENVERWANSINGEKFTQDFPSTAMGLTPDSYQISAIQGLSASGGVIGAFMGAGKTLMATLAAIGESVNGAERCWIVCPLNAFPAWERARDAELSNYFKEVKVMSKDSAHKYTAVSRGDVLIVDEIHHAGSAKARRTQSLHTIRSKFRFGIGLTGTVAHGGVEKAASMMDLGVPGRALFTSKWEVGAAFNCLAQKDLGNRKVMALERPSGAAKERFMAWLDHGIYQVRPESRDVQMSFTLPGQETQQVSFAEPWLSLSQSVAKGAHTILAETGELPHAQAVAHWLAREGAEGKIDWLMDELMQLPEGTQVVIAANYTNSLDLAEAALKGAGYTLVRVDGSVTGAERVTAEKDFQQGRAQIFLGQIHAASESMNLQCATISLTLDVSWSAIDYAQFLCRTHRRGQTAPCVHVDLVANRFQQNVLSRLRLGQDFASDCAEYAELRRALPTMSAQENVG